MDDIRAIFLNTYPKVPEQLRDEIIVMIDGKSYNWNTAYLEIKENKDSELSKKILKTLKIIGII